MERHMDELIDEKPRQVDKPMDGSSINRLRRARREYQSPVQDQLIDDSPKKSTFKDKLYKALGNIKQNLKKEAKDTYTEYKKDRVAKHAIKKQYDRKLYAATLKERNRQRIEAMKVPASKRATLDNRQPSKLFRSRL